MDKAIIEQVKEKDFTTDEAMYVKEGHHLKKAIEIMRRPAYGGIYGKNKD
ncbi:MAG: hypothetical protein K6G85_03855 [Eubacterium sp.]|nr:hypothetical protein [Eubacterium sp.]